MTTNTIKLDLSQVADKGLQEKVDKELEKVLENILDPNTKAEAKRKLTVNLTLSGNAERTIVQADIEVKSTLAPQNGVATTILVGRDYETGKIHANELKSGIPGQTYFDDNGDMRTDTGELIEKVEKQESSNIIDYNKKKAGN